MFLEEPTSDSEDDHSDDPVIVAAPRPADPAVVAATAGRLVPPPRTRTTRRRRRRAHRARDPPPDEDADADAFSIAQFCRRHAISQSLYFTLQAAGLGPRTMKVGGRVLISREAARAWRRAREAAARRG
jgi:hypothetical protein